MTGSDLLSLLSILSGAASKLTRSSAIEALSIVLIKRSLTFRSLYLPSSPLRKPAFFFHTGKTISKIYRIFTAVEQKLLIMLLSVYYFSGLAPVRVSRFSLCYSKALSPVLQA